jgi:hypothetical protein
VLSLPDCCVWRSFRCYLLNLYGTNVRPHLTRPVLLLPLLPVVWFTWWVGRQYLHVSRELKRLESLKKSPVFVLFSETLQVGCL